ncbi:hypothetical protein ACWGSK_13225 [Nocardiopsis sp. NPDC055551]
MRTAIMPPPAAPETLDLPDSITPASLTALDITEAEYLWVDHLSDETEEERAARLTAGADILHDRLSEIASRLVAPEVIENWSR